MNLYVFYSHCTSNALFWISAHVHEHKCAINFIQQCRATWCFLNQVESCRFLIQSVLEQVSQWFRGPIRWTQVSFLIESAVSNWFEWFNKSFIKTYTYCHLLVVLLSSSFINGMPNMSKYQHKNTFIKIYFNYQYWPKFLHFRPKKEKRL